MTKRVVCISWKDQYDCIKRDSNNTTATISYVWAVHDENKIENWGENKKICITLQGENTAQFGIKDGKGCSNPFPEPVYYNRHGILDIACVSPEEYDDDKEACLWFVFTEICDIEESILDWIPDFLVPR